MLSNKVVMYLIDHHCHLQHEKYENMKEEVIKQTCEEMSYVVVSGANEKWNKKAIEIAEKCKNFFATIGYHPVDAVKYSDKEWEEKLKTLEELAKHPKVIAIGEIGLDYHWIKDEKTNEIAKQRFLEQIRLADKLGLGVVIHSRDAELDAIKLVAENKRDNKVAFHCYSSHKHTELLHEHRFYAAVCTNIVRSKSVKKFVKRFGIERLLTETDAPYLSPFVGEINYPRNVKIVIEKISNILDMSLDDVSKKIKENFELLYNINK